MKQLKPVLKYRVSLPGLKGFARVYAIKPGSSLYSFHKRMRADMDFPQDQLFLFKAVDEEGEAIARYSPIDLGFGTADEVSVGECHKKAEDHFVYFYDTTNKKSVLLDFEGEEAEEPNTIYPILLETKGPNPKAFENGYVAFEDLPDDKRTLPDDDDDDDFDDLDEEEDNDEDDDFEGEEIADEDDED